MHFRILCYPVIDFRQLYDVCDAIIDKDNWDKSQIEVILEYLSLENGSITQVPDSFIVHASDDTVVNIIIN